MPFTLSHAVAVIPLYKYLGKFGALSALIIGSMTPDFAYFSDYIQSHVNSHSLIGIYLFAVPAGLTVYYLYHFLMAPVLVSLLPKAIKKHLHEDLFLGRLPDIPSYTLVFSLMLGALTHVVWDFFTHQSGIPQFVPWMEVSLTSIDDYDITTYRILQHFSSLFGLSLLVFWIWQWIGKKKHANVPSTPASHAWQAPKALKLFSLVVLLTVPTIVGLIHGYNSIPDNDSMYDLYAARVFLRFGVTGSAGAFIVCSAALGLLYQYFIRSSLPSSIQH